MDLGEAGLAVFGGLKCSLLISYDKLQVDVHDIMHGTKAIKFRWSELRRNVKPLTIVAYIFKLVKLTI